MGEGRNVYRALVGKLEGKRPLGRPRRRREDGIKMDLREIGWGVWSGFTWLRIGIVGGDEPSGSGATELVSTAIFNGVRNQLFLFPSCYPRCANLMRKRT
jgi:hypothetical protein